MKYILLILAAIALFVIIDSILEPRLPRITRTVLGKGDTPVLRAVFFSDLHAEFCFVSPKTLADTIRREKELNGLDMVIFGGDLVNDPLKAGKAVSFMKVVKDTCDDLDLRFIGVTGNHDVEVSSKDIRECGFENLDNDYTVFPTEKGDIYLSGIPDSGRKNRKWYTPKDPEGDHILRILLSHNPDAALHFSEDHGYDHMISGHIHGGQIRTLSGIEFKLLRKDELPRKGIISGKHMINNMECFISKGIGCVFLPFRFRARPEINILEFRIPE